MLFTLVWVLAGVTAWCVASLAVALLVGPLIRRPRSTRRPAVRSSAPDRAALPHPVSRAA